MKDNTKKIICDLDNTITIENQNIDYADKLPNEPLIEKLRYYKSLGFEIIIHTARNMRTHDGDISKINIHTLPIIINWLERHNVPYDGIIVGKPYCGTEGFYVDDRAIRPNEFINKDIEEINKILES
jgi:capsule biosynthesis phosphatase